MNPRHSVLELQSDPCVQITPAVLVSLSHCGSTRLLPQQLHAAGWQRSPLTLLRAGSRYWHVKSPATNLGAQREGQTVVMSVCQTLGKYTLERM